MNPNIHARTFLTETGLEIWKVRGLYGQVFVSKESAEIAAREEFPDEDATYRYSRLSFCVLQGLALHFAELSGRILRNFDVK